MSAFLLRHLPNPFIPKCVYYLVFACAVALTAGVSVAGQSTTPTSSTTSALTPQGMSPGSPAGSYALSGLDDVNLFNGNHNVRIPLLNVGGRGSAGYTMTVSTSTKSWQVRTEPGQDTNGGGGNINDRFFPQWKQWNTLSPGYGPGVLQGRKTGVGTKVRRTCDTCVLICPRLTPMYRYTLTRLTFITPDGSEHELRDESTGGKPMPVEHARCHDASNQGAYRGYRFTSADGSGMTFVSDAPIHDDVRVGPGLTGSWLFNPSGTLYLRDGTRYGIQNGRVEWIQDRNGNRITFEGGITDSLNRKITIEYGLEEAPYGLHDRITYHGFAGANRVIRVSRRPLGESLRNPYALRTYAELFPELNGTLGFGTFNPQVTWAVWLPDGRKYQIFYNSYAEVARVELPTGGAMEYDMTPGSGVIVSSGATGSSIEERQIYRRLVESRTYKNLTDTTPTSRTAYLATGSLVRVEQYDGENHLLALTNHYFSGDAAESLFTREEGSLYSPAGEGRELATDSLDTVNQSTVLRRVATIWAQRAPVSWVGNLEVHWPDYPPPGLAIQPDNDPRVTDTYTIIEPAGANLISRTTAISPIDQSIGFDLYNNQTDVWEYNSGVGAPGDLVRHTHTTYVTAASYTDQNSPHLISLPAQTSIFNASGIERARTNFEYDNYVPDPPSHRHAAMIPRGDISGLDSAYTPSLTVRGNVTATTQSFFDSSGSVTGSITAYVQYDVAGNIVKAFDARGHATLFEFDDRFGSPDGEARSNSAPTELSSVQQSSYAFATLVTNAFGHTSYAQFDYHLGRPVDGEDANGIVASGYYNDSLDRPKQVIRAANQNPSIKSQTTFYYDDVAHIITTRSDLTSYDDKLIKSEIVYDGLGRTIESRQYETATAFVAVQTQYDGLGRAHKTSNPYRAGENIVWTITGYDALGRVTSVMTPDNAVVTTGYSGNRVLVSDQAGKKRISLTDGLGRLTDVWEVTPDTAAESVSFPNFADVTRGYRTTYEYDTLDSLTKVTQGSQPARVFDYDALKRLKSATNPESGTVTYKYDENGNLTVKTDARGVSAHYEYDVLNRAMRRWYNGSNSVTETTHNSPALPSGVGVSDEVKYFYDLQTPPNGAPTFDRGYSIGRLIATTYGGGSAGTYLGYDATGKPLRSIQQTGGINYQTSAVYNAAGGITTLTYPSGRTISSDYDGAGRTRNLTGNLGDGFTRTYSGDAEYSPFGGLAKERFGTDTATYHKRHYNIRGQMYDARVSTQNTDGGWNRGSIVNYYSMANYGFGTSGPDNNGNLHVQQSWVPTNEEATTYSFMQQNYDYDALNRITWVAEYANGQNLTGSQSFEYDRWGNRNITGSIGANINNKSFSRDSNTNRLGVPQEQSGAMAYDSAGNLTTDTYSGSAVTRVYDAENRMTKETQANNYEAGLYSYDGDGRRVKRKAGGTETWQVYGLSGELLVEYAPNAAPNNPQKEYGYRNGELLITTEVGGSSSQSGGSPYGGAAVAIPGTIEAENFDNGGAGVGYHDTTPGTHGQDYDQPPSYPPPSFRQPTDVDIYKSTGYSNNYLLLGQAGDWTNYTVNVASTGTYTMQAQVTWGGTSGSPGTFHVEVDGVDKTGPLQIPDNNWAFTIITKTGVQLNAGIHVMRIVWDTNAPNGYSGDIDYLNFTLTSAGGTPVTNLALNKPATQVSTYDVAVASRAVDGNTDGNYGNNSVTHTLGGAQEWWQVDLGNSYLLQTIKLWNRTDCCSDRLSNFYVFVSDQPFTSYDLTTTLNQSGVSNYHTPGQGGTPTSVTVNRTGRYVRVQLVNPGLVSLAEVEVWGASGGATYRASTDFTSTQGQNNWYYLDENGLPMTYDAVNNVWVGSEGPYQWLWSSGGHPGAVHHVVRQWRAPSAGSIRITGNASDGHTACGDGVIVTIKKGAEVLWQQTIANGNTTGLSYDLTTSVASGDQINFVINRNGDAYCDATNFDPTITLSSGGGGSAAQINWLVTDQLGTPRIILDKTGSRANVSRHDYLPFGEELGAGTGNRTPVLGYTASDNVRQKFTEKERDNETGLDYFGARYYGSVQGRFTSADPLMPSGRATRPQSWNRYSYVLNNPLRLVDPSGMIDQDPRRTSQGRPVNPTEPIDMPYSPNGEDLDPIAIIVSRAIDTPDPSELLSTPDLSSGMGPALLAMPPAPGQINDYHSLDISFDLGYDFGLALKQDRFNQCYVGAHGGYGLGVLPLSGTYTTGQVFNQNGRASTPDSIRSALTGWTVVGQATLPTTDVIAVAGGQIRLSAFFQAKQQPLKPDMERVFLQFR